MGEDIAAKIDEFGRRLESLELKSAVRPADVDPVDTLTPACTGGAKKWQHLPLQSSHFCGPIAHQMKSLTTVCE